MAEPALDGILNILVDNKAITPDVASKVNLESLNTGELPEAILSKKKLASLEEIAKARAQILGVSFVNLSTRGISPEILTFIPEPVARRYTLFPFDYGKTRDELQVAMIDPLDVQVIEFLEKKSGKKIIPCLALKDDIQAVIDEKYSGTLGEEVTEALKETIPSKVKTIEASQIGEIIREAPIARIVSTLLEFAIKSRASDIHIEPLEKKTRVRYRIDGILHEKLALPRTVHDAVVSRIKILSDMKIDERRIPQDGRFNFRLGDEEVDLRISTLPSVHGEKVVMRLLKKTGGIPSLPELGLRGTALKNLREAISRPHGIILVTGPTGSGKTTTLYSILSELNTTQVNIITLEDPVEYGIPGVNQVQVNPAAGLTFATGLRSFLRQDPNIILVGEIRDRETTQLAIQAALTGHLVFSTLHTNSASGAIPRLLDMGAEPFLLASCLNCIVGQRISRRICHSCQESFEPDEKVIADIKKVLNGLFPLGQENQEKKSKKTRLWRGKGCSSCNQTNYYGRVGIFEVLLVTDHIARLILERAPSSVIEKKAIEQGMITMRQDGHLKALEGITTIEEVLRVAQT